MTDNILPEEKLFKIIQKEKNAPPKAPGVAAQDRRERGVASSITRLIFGWTDSLAARVKKLAKSAGSSSRRQLDEIKLSTINIGLAVLLVLLLAFSAYYVMTGYPNIAKKLNTVVRARSIASSVKRESEELRPLDYYMEETRRRDIFNASRALAPAPSAETVSVGEAKSAYGDLKLRGHRLERRPESYDTERKGQ